MKTKTDFLKMKQEGEPIVMLTAYEREINHHYGEKPKKKTESEKKIEEEIGDVLFVLVCLANSLHISLDEAHDMVMEKFNTRDKDRWTRKEEGK